MGIKKGKTVYNKILARMGCGDYKKWNIALFETKYFYNFLDIFIN